ncbi:MAG: molybdopterin molybdotransferase MoeA [Deltaproteobacteria bacterium]|nr:molybdopterin molybdotransferase MoeA [Deltaproteobacteria bacterium]
MLTFAEARARILAEAPRQPEEEVALEDCVGRVLAEDATAPGPLPPFDYSAMDGYALRAADAPGPCTLPVVGESRAGSAPATLGSGVAARIFTGAPLPAGADSVLPQEDVERCGDTIVLAQPPTPGRHIRRAGEDLATGAVAVARGTRLTPTHLALLATVDRPRVRVSCAPRVVILSTGDELRDPGTPARPGSVVDSNGPMLVALCRRVGAVVERTRAPDDLEAIRAAIRDALARADVLLTIGGVSVGEHDHVRDALAAEGVGLDFWKVAIKPGKPLAFGRHESRAGATGRGGNARVLGLPGNPAAAFVTFTAFVAPLLRAMQGDAHPFARTVTARLTRTAKAGPSRLELMRARLANEGGELRATVLDNQASGAVTSIAWADAIVPVAAGSTIEAGTLVEAWLLDAL